MERLCWALEGSVVDGNGLLIRVLTAVTNFPMDASIFWKRCSN